MKRFLYSIAKTWLGGLILHWILAYGGFLIPGEKLIESEILLAFHHPSPSYPVHILIVPRSRYRSLDELPSGDLRFEEELFKTVRELVKILGLENQGYRLVANGGSAQEVDHLHFHLISASSEFEQENNG